MRKPIAIIAACVLAAGCTGQSTRMAIDRYHQTQNHTAVAFANAYRVANEQTYLATSLQLRRCEDEPQRQEVLTAYAEARTGIEEARLQFERAQALSLLTVGTYLYDRQGWLNILVEDQSGMLDRTLGAVEAGNKAAGMERVGELVPRGAAGEKELGPVPQRGGGASLQQMFDRFGER